MNDPVALSRIAFEAARLSLAHLRFHRGDEWQQTLVAAVSICASALEVERVSVWCFSRRFERLECNILHVRSGQDPEEPLPVLYSDEMPAYVEALRTRKTVVANDVRTDPATVDLWRRYLEPLGISSLLDAPIYLGGEVTGVVCHEHVGPARIWTAEEIELASSVADIASVVMKQMRRTAIEDELQRMAAERETARDIATLAQLAGAVAQDFALMVGRIAGLADELAQLEECSEQATGILELATAVEQHATRLQDLASYHQSGHEGATLTHVVEHLMPLIEQIVRPWADLDWSCDGDLEPGFEIDRFLVQRVLLQLCLNGGDAIQRGGYRGHIEVEITGAEHEGSPGTLLRVSDNGVGMGQSARAHLWERYFTTKPRGTGIALHALKCAIDDAGGTVEVATSPRAGTTFSVWLPHSPALPDGRATPDARAPG